MTAYTSQRAPEPAFEVWNQDAFDKETNEKEADFSDVKKLFEVLHSDRSNVESFKAQLENVFDIDGFLHYLAAN